MLVWTIYIIYRITHKHMHVYIYNIYLPARSSQSNSNQSSGASRKNCQARGRLPSAYVIETSTASLEKDHELVGSTWNHLVSKGWKDWIFVAWHIILRWKLTPLQKIPWIFKVPWFFEFEDFHLVQPSQGEKYPKRVSVVKWDTVGKKNLAMSCLCLAVLCPMSEWYFSGKSESASNAHNTPSINWDCNISSRQHQHR